MPGSLTLQSQLREAFAQIAASELPPYPREREVVSLFVFRHLLPTLHAGAPLHHPAQVGIEVAVPQRRDRPNPRRNPDVCKDLVLWPAPGMTCWDELGAPTHFPLAVIEWKTINRKDSASVARTKRAREHPDLDWLRWFVTEAPTADGYAVTVDLGVSEAIWQVHRVTAGGEEPRWFSGSPASV